MGRVWTLQAIQKLIIRLTLATPHTPLWSSTLSAMLVTGHWLVSDGARKAVRYNIRVVYSFWCHCKGPGVPVHSYIGIQMWISWTLGLQSAAQTSTKKQVVRMIQAYQFVT